MEADLRTLLDSWPYDEHSNVRRIVAGDGREKIQVRVQEGPFQGILQMELDGRPDGARPHDRNYAFDFWQDQLGRHVKAEGTKEGFGLGHAASEELFEESRAIYERYIFLLRLHDFERVIRDTERNMHLFRFVNTYADSKEDRERLERWWPYILRIHATARIMIAVARKDTNEALAIVKETRQRIDSLPELEFDEFQIERKRSLDALEELAGQLRKEHPASPTERLEEELKHAIAVEDYESAAKLRDQLHAIQDEPESN